MEIKKRKTNGTKSDHDEKPATKVVQKEVDDDESVLARTWEIFTCSLPLALASFGNTLKPTITLLAVNSGYKDEATFAAIGLGTALQNVFVRGPIVGYNHSTTTYLSQAYGAKDYKLLGEMLNKVRIFYSIIVMPIIAVLCFSGHILHSWGQPYDLSFSTQYYIRLSIWAFFGQLHYDINRRYLSAIGQRDIQVGIPYITLVLHFVWGYIFLNKMKLGVEGAAIVQLLQFFANYLMSEILIRGTEAGKHVRWFTMENFKGWSTMFWDGLPSAIYELVNRISYEASTFCAGFITVELVIVNSAYGNLFWVFFVMTAGVQHTSSGLIGNNVGAKNAKKVKQYISANLCFAVLYAVFVVVVLNLFSDQILSNYTSNESTLLLMKKILAAFGSTISLMIIKDIMFGIIIGLGMQAKTTKLVIILNFFVWLIVIYTLTFVFGFYNAGPWISLSIVAGTLIFFVFRIVNNIDIDQVIKDAAEKRAKLQ